MKRHPPVPPRADLIRSPTGPFGWLDAALLHEGWLARITPQAVSVLVLLALAADRHGASFFSRERMTKVLGINRLDVEHALEALVHLKLVGFRPWSKHHIDGVWQLLPLPERSRPKRNHPTEPIRLSQILKCLNLEA